MVASSYTVATVQYSMHTTRSTVALSFSAWLATPTHVRSPTQVCLPYSMSALSFSAWLATPTHVRSPTQIISCSRRLPLCSAVFLIVWLGGVYGGAISSCICCACAQCMCVCVTPLFLFLTLGGRPQRPGVSITARPRWGRESRLWPGGTFTWQRWPSFAEVAAFREATGAPAFSMVLPFQRHSLSRRAPDYSSLLSRIL